MLNIALCKNKNDWHLRFEAALQAAIASGHPVTYALIDINANNWISKIEKFDMVVWKPNNMGPESAAHFKEKVYFIENYLKKRVVPNFNTVWHFESKVAQKYIFEKFNIPTPKTVSTFDYDDAVTNLANFEFPVVFKKSAGAAASNVVLVNSYSKAFNLLNTIFCGHLVDQAIGRRGAFWSRFSMHYLRVWLGWKNGAPNQPVAYWQEFVPDNTRDLRITVIGNKYAFGFWRNNRPGDFRASGSGSIDYSTPIPEHVLRYCLSISDQLRFDSMAYDVIFSGDEFKIVEMSYGYSDQAVHKANGYYELVDDSISFRSGHFWPQEIWIRWCIKHAAK